MAAPEEDADERTARDGVLMAGAGIKRLRERWLLELTHLPTVAGREHGIVRWVEQWVARRRNLMLARDRAGNLFITQRRRQTSHAPLLMTAHLDHPGFVVTTRRGRDVELEFRGGVHHPYFENAVLDIFSGRERCTARIVTLDRAAKPFMRVTAVLDRRDAPVASNDIGRFHLARTKLPRIASGQLHTYACDDLSAVVAALSALDVLRRRRGYTHVGVLLTRAEEVGFIGTLAACVARSVPRAARLICLENSRSFPDSPIGAGPIVRVGDKASVFDPTLTNDISQLMMDYEKTHPAFRWQRKLMPGGTCEATAFSTYGYRATCLCLPLGNYHNMVDIDGVQAGTRPARVGPEFISVADFHGLVEMLIACAERLDAPDRPSLRRRLQGLLREHGHLVR